MPTSGQQMGFSAQQQRQVSTVKFDILSKQEIINMAVCEIKQTRIYDSETQLPLKEGLNDPRMGTSSPFLKCMTCEGSSLECPGHFGYMDLAKPVYHYGYLEMIKKILQCVCANCSKLLIPENDPSYIKIKNIKNGKIRLREVLKEKYKQCKTLNHDNIDEKQDDENQQERMGCGYDQPTFSIKGIGIIMKPFISKKDEDELEVGKQEQEFYAEKALKIFKSISNEDAYMLGLDTSTRPENLILEVLPVAPPPVRPAIQMDATAKSEDDLTHIYMEILKKNLEIKRYVQSGMPETKLNEHVSQMQFYIAALMNNELNNMPQAKTKKSKRPIKSIRERLKGKEGRIRKNLMGKRVDFSARTVVSPDPNLFVDELGVPRSMALNLTFPEQVTHLNIEKMQQLISNGPYDWPGAKSYTRNDGKTFDLRFKQNREDIKLNCGDIVERHIVDGDYVVFNRQPTLHRMSMMGHRIRILPYSSFRLNLSVTTPYNADFDGDEMNMHVPQNYESKAELKNIMHVPKQIVSSQANKPVMGLVQDTLCGIRLFTRRDTFLTQSQVMNLLLWIDHFNGEIPQPCILRPQKLWSGKQIISLLFPEINLDQTCIAMKGKKDEELSLRDGKIIIEKGVLLSGMLDKGVVGSSAGGIVHIIWLDYGWDQAAQFLSYAQRVVNNWLQMHGFSVGCADIFPSDECKKAVGDELDKAYNIVPNLFQKASQKKMDHQLGKSMLESFEHELNLQLNNIFNDACNQAQAMMNDKNNIYNMVAAGSKGSNLNIAQIMVCVGQQNVEGKRIPYGFYRRTLPHYTKDDYNYESRGFVINSYLTGLSPTEFFFHAMGGREGLIDTACKTSETGYLQRRLIKALEDVMVKYDGTVRDSSGNIVQFLYGEDGMAGEYIEQLIANFIQYNNTQMIENFRFVDPNNENQDIAEQLQDYQKYFDENVFEQMIDKDTELRQVLIDEYEELMGYRSKLRSIFPNLENKYYLPVNIDRLIKQVKKKQQKNQDEISRCTLNPIDVIQQVNQTIKTLVISPGNDRISLEAQNNGILLLKIMIKFFLSSKQVCIKQKLTQSMFNEIIGEIESKFQKAIAHPGEMVGIVCAQSLGEPTTQMTLNTFHFAGNSAHNVTLGVPRIKEILNVARNIKTPYMKIYIKQNQVQPSEMDELIKQLQANLEYSTLAHITEHSQLYYDPDVKNSIIEEDQELLDIYYFMPDEDDQVKLSSWVLRIQCEKFSMIDRKFDSLKDIVRKIKEKLPTQLQIIYNQSQTPDHPVIRIRVKDVEDVSSEEQIQILKDIEQYLLYNLRLKGISNIKKVFWKKYKNKYIDPADHSYKEVQEWMLETDGSNLKEIITYDEVDATRTTTNNCSEINEVLGIEAARLSLIKEIRYILDIYGIYVNYRHLATLCDIMTSRGVLTSISRHGINKVVDGPLRRASFEQTVEILFQAGVFSESQSFHGISENLMFGQLCRLGTGFFDIVLNTDLLKDPKTFPTTEYEFQEEYINEEMEQVNPAATPFIAQTPFNMGGQTPAGMTPANMTPYDQSFTPMSYHGIQSSPMYVPNNQTGSPMLNQSPAYMANQKKSMQNTILSPNYQIISPGYSPAQASSPRYLSPSQSNQMLQYSPNSPVYNSTSVSPSYSSQKAYSPTSPGYKFNSPSYQQNFSPSSPNYSGTPNSQNTPSSQNQNTQPYSPNSPIYNMPVNQLNQQVLSPIYETNVDANNKGDYSENEEDEDEMDEEKK